ncbi:MAG: preprotein translocase subunit SecY [Solirubrobacterales bacterium]|nr:preprotein translocase subunit SecY [Solirubrobacterales bacterium]
MISTILGAFRVKEIRNKLLFTAALLALYRLGSYLPAPGINAHAAQAIQSQLGSSGIFGLMNTLNGGGLSRIAVFSLGIMPFITSSIIFQLLQVVVPSLEQLRKEPTGQEKLTQYQRYLTVGLAFAQSVGYVFLFRSLEKQAGTTLIADFNLAKVLLIALTLTAGTILLMWFGELITQRGIGNGISLMIFASIVSRIPSGIQSWWNSDNATFKVMMPFLAVLIVAAIVYVTEGKRRIPIQYARRQVGQRMVSGQQTFMPLRVNMAGVIPVIFAATVMTIPPTVGSMIGKNKRGFGTDLSNFFAPNGWHYVLGECILIILFTYFYTAVTFNPVEQSDDLRKAGGFIPGVRPGRPTAEFLDRILARLTLPGALFLAAVAALPALLISSTGASFAFGGTSILIVIGVALDTIRQLEAQLQMRNYEGFLK